MQARERWDKSPKSSKIGFRSCRHTGTGPQGRAEPKPVLQLHGHAQAHKDVADVVRDEGPLRLQLQQAQLDRHSPPQEARRLLPKWESSGVDRCIAAAGKGR